MKTIYTSQVTIDIDENIKQIRFYKTEKGWHIRLFLKKPISLDKSFRKRIVQYDDLLRIMFDIQRSNKKGTIRQRMFDESENKEEIITIA